MILCQVFWTLELILFWWNERTTVLSGFYSLTRILNFFLDDNVLQKKLPRDLLRLLNVLVEEGRIGFFLKNSILRFSRWRNLKIVWIRGKESKIKIHRKIQLKTSQTKQKPYTKNTLTKLSINFWPLNVLTEFSFHFRSRAL